MSIAEIGKYASWVPEADTTLNRDMLVCVNALGETVEADDDADYSFAGVNIHRVETLADGTTRAGELAECNVQRQGDVLTYLYKAGTNPTRILDPVYCRDGVSVQDAASATNDIYAGRVIRFLRSANPADYKQETYVTASCYALITFNTNVLV